MTPPNRDPPQAAALARLLRPLDQRHRRYSGLTLARHPNGHKALSGGGFIPRPLRLIASNDGWEPLPTPPHAKPYFRHFTLGEPSQVWKYLNAAGEQQGYICRFETVKPDGSPDKEFRPYRYGCLTNGAGRRRLGWHWKGWLNERPLYRLPDLLARADAPVIICEGEKTADAARQLFVEWEATTPMNGANPDFSYRVGFRAAVTRLAAEPMKRVVVVG